MSRDVIIVSAAERELADAAEWYETRRPGLGGALLDEVASALRSIVGGFDGSPYMADEGEGEVRIFLLRRFPRGVVFVISAERAEVLAVADLRRRPGYWRDA